MSEEKMSAEEYLKTVNELTESVSKALTAIPDTSLRSKAILDLMQLNDRALSLVGDLAQMASIAKKSMELNRQILEELK